MKLKTITAEVDKLEIGFDMDFRCVLTVVRVWIKKNEQHEKFAHDHAHSFCVPSSTSARNRAERLASQIAALTMFLGVARCDAGAFVGSLIRVRLEVDSDGIARTVGIGHITKEVWLNRDEYSEENREWLNAIRPYQE